METRRRWSCPGSSSGGSGSSGREDSDDVEPLQERSLRIVDSTVRYSEFPHVGDIAPGDSQTLDGEGKYSV